MATPQKAWVKDASVRTFADFQAMTIQRIRLKAFERALGRKEKERAGRFSLSDGETEARKGRQEGERPEMGAGRREQET
jgi:hypothetical protein